MYARFYKEYTNKDMGNNYGLNNDYDYYEFGIDSLDNSGGYDAGYTPLNWPCKFTY